MRSRMKNHYLKIPVGEDLRDADSFLEKAMDLVAQQKGYKGRKFYVSKEFGCSKNEAKLMTERVVTPSAVYLDQTRFPSKDAYRCVRKINTALYATVIMSVVKEYVKNVPPHEKQNLLKYIADWGMVPGTYQQVFCHPVFSGFKTVEADEATADYINGIDNAKADYENLIKELSNNGTVVK